MFEYYWVDLHEAAKKGRPLVKRISNSEADQDDEHRVKMKNPDLQFPIDPGQVSGKDLNYLIVYESKIITNPNILLI